MSAGTPEAGSMAAPSQASPANGFVLRVIGSDTAVTAHLSGELDTVTAPAFAQQLVDLFEAGARQLTIDLAGLSFIDSSGLSALVSTLKRYRAAGGEVVLRSPSRATAKVLEICGLTQVFTIEPDGSDPAVDTQG